MTIDSSQGGFIAGQIEGEIASHSFCDSELITYSRRAPGKDDGSNDDAIAWLPWGAGAAVLALADGAGGMPHADDASRVALETFRATIAAARESGDALREAILTGFDAANTAVFALGGAATTLAVVQVNGATIRTYHAGDSPVLVVMADGMVKHQTIDHTPLGYAVEAGVFDADEAIHHEARHIISNMVGSPDMRVEMSSPIRLERGDTVLVSSDGLFDNLYGGEIIQTACRPDVRDVANTLVALATERMAGSDEDDGQPCKPDDLTFALFRPTSA